MNKWNWIDFSNIVLWIIQEHCSTNNKASSEHQQNPNYQTAAINNM